MTEIDVQVSEEAKKVLAKIIKDHEKTGLGTKAILYLKNLADNSVGYALILDRFIIQGGCKIWSGDYEIYINGTFHTVHVAKFTNCALVADRADGDEEMFSKCYLRFAMTDPEWPVEHAIEIFTPLTNCITFKTKYGNRCCKLEHYDRVLSCTEFVVDPVTKHIRNNVLKPIWKYVNISFLSGL